MAAYLLQIVGAFAIAICGLSLLGSVTNGSTDFVVPTAIGTIAGVLFIVTGRQMRRAIACPALQAWSVVAVGAFIAWFVV